jgi:glutathione reductase (NADPH)
VIGGGSGGVASARRAAGYGAKVGLIERQALGGTCVNVGCVPKKVMWNAAAVSEVLHESKHFGFDVPGGYSFNWKALKDMRDAYITRLNGIYTRMLGNSDVEVIRGYGSFTDAKTVSVDGKSYTADHIMIAVGGMPRLHRPLVHLANTSTQSPPRPYTNTTTTTPPQHTRQAGDARHPGNRTLHQ